MNLIGEHTDYNEGFVMPAAIALDTRVAVTLSEGDSSTIYSAQQSQPVLWRSAETNPQPRHDWSDYVRGVAVELHAAGYSLPETNLVIESNIPMGAGLSSSAAIEVATAFALLAIADGTMQRTEVAKLCQRAENQFAGARCGIMDQFASAHGRSGHAILLDCRSLELRYLPLPKNVRLVICNSMVKHSIAAGEYNRRRAECEQAVSFFRQLRPEITALRDVTEDDLEQHGSALPETLLRRSRHVITENARVLRAADALDAGDLVRFGQLMYESHTSLRNDYEVSCPELDLLVELASRIPGTYGARMTGGGFGGCTINLVKESAVEEFRATILGDYREKTGLTPEIYVTEASDGAAAMS